MELSILIVDDDKILVDKLEETVNWNKIGISMVFTAYNIRQAQKILEEFPIQLMLCDIDMPQGSGLELLEWLRSRKMDTECIFLSSYANFAYAQKALRLSSREYLLKPISNQELEQTLLKITEEVSRKKPYAVHGNAGSEKERVWKRFLLADAEEASEQRKQIEKMYAKEDRFYFQIVKVFLKGNETERQKKSALCSFALNSTEAEVVVNIGDNVWGMVLKSDNEEKEKAEELAAYLHKNVSLPVSLYMGKYCETEGLYEAWGRLRRIENQELPRKNGVLMESEIFRTKETETPPWEIWQSMMVSPQGAAHVQTAVEEYLQRVFQKGELDIRGLRQFMRECSQFLYTYLAQQKLKFHQVFETNEFEQREAEAYVFYEGCMDFISYLFQTLLGNLGYNQENAVERVKEYIDKNLDKDLSRSVLAKAVFLSEDYISKLFKSKTGISLTSYVAWKRMEKAKEYLEFSDLTVSKIALEVGYHNFSYFSKTFRDITGMTPNEYRNDKKTNCI